MVNHSRQVLVISVLGLAATWGMLAVPEAQERGCGTGAAATIPAFVLQAAHGSLADVASALSAARVCAGLVVREVETGRVAKAWRRASSAPSVPLAAFITAFEAGHRDRVVERIKGVLVIRERDGSLTSSSPLQVSRPRFSVNGVSALEALRQIVATIDPARAPRAGYVGSVLTAGDEPPPKTEDIEGPRIALALSQPTLLTMLVEVSAQAPGVVWVLRAPPSRDTQSQGSEYRLSSYFAAGTATDIGTMIIR